jgi:REP element-mobilizing transposase RayT
MGIKKAKKYTLSEIIRGFKTFSSKQINILSKNKFVWQRSFYDHIIRNERSLYEIRNYIINNPAKWELEKNQNENMY